jgi:hypothetical protein
VNLEVNKQGRSDMDRSMKVMFGMMTLAICLLAFTMIGNQSQQAFAGEYVGGADRGSDEPTIVWFGVSLGSNNTNISDILYHRLWSDGRLQMRRAFRSNSGCDPVNTSCDWFDVEPPPGGDGVACGADVNNDSVVDTNDILAVIDWWSDDIVCEPTYDCLDLNNLPPAISG